MFIISACKLHIKRLLLSPFFVLVIISCVLGTSACVAYFNTQKNGSEVRVGVVYNKKSSLQEQIYNNFSNAGSIKTITFSNFDEMERQVASAKIECGLEFNDIDKKLKTKDYSNFATIIYSPSSTMTGPVGELFCASVIKASAPIISKEYLDEIGVDIKLSKIKKEITDYYNANIFMKLEFIDGESGQALDKSVRLLDPMRIANGISTLVAFVFVYFSSARLIEDNKGELFAKLGETLRLKNTVSQHFAQFIGVAATMLVGEVITAISSKQLDFYIVSASTLLYAIGMACFAYVLVSVVRNIEYLYYYFPIVAVFSLIFGGVFIDLGEINSILGLISRCTLSEQFVKASYGNGLAGLLLYTCSLILLSVVITFIKKVLAKRSERLVY